MFLEGPQKSWIFLATESGDPGFWFLRINIYGIVYTNWKSCTE